MRRAISPRLATRIFLNMGRLAANGDQDLFEHALTGASLDHEQGLPVFHGLAVLANDAGDRAGFVGLDLVEDLHGLHDADGLAFLDLASDLDERLCSGAGRPVESTYHR